MSNPHQEQLARRDKINRGRTVTPRTVTPITTHSIGCFESTAQANTFLKLLIEVLWAGDWEELFNVDPTSLLPRIQADGETTDGHSIILGWELEIETTELQAQAIDLAYQVWRASA